MRNASFPAGIIGMNLQVVCPIENAKGASEADQWKESDPASQVTNSGVSLDKDRRSGELAHRVTRYRLHSTSSCNNL